MSDRLPVTALIPAHDDAHTLAWCLDSLVAHVEAVVVLDDASSDETPEVVADAALEHGHVRLIRNTGRQHDWIEARNRLLAATDARRLLWLDADDVLVERNVWALRKALRSGQPVVRLQILELWGDVHHTTQRWRHYDRCHCLMDRRRCGLVSWTGRTGARIERDTGRRAINSEGPLLVHAKGVKPDRRLVARTCLRDWMRAGKPGRTVEEWAGLDRMAPQDLHRMAVEFLLTSSGDRPRWAYDDACQPVDGAPRLPRAILESPQRERFRLVYEAGALVDREEVPCG